MLGCPDCGRFRMGSVNIERAHVVAGERFVGKLPAYKCKSCASTFVQPDADQDFMQTLARVAAGEEPERDNAFEIRRTTIDAKRTFWSSLFGRDGAANDVERKTRGRAQ